MSLYAGWDSFTPDPGTKERMTCRVCDEEMAIDRNVNGPTGWAEAMAKRGHPHDHFYCKHANEPWHQQALRLRQEQANTASAAMKEILEGEIIQIIVNRQTTEGYG